MSESEGFLGRWSRRKRAALAGAAVAEPDLAPSPPAAAPPGPPPAEAAPAAVGARAEFDPATLPPVESLTIDSDITGFLRPQVPAALRSAALRRVWSLDPAIRDYIGPADYAWDYNAPDGVPGFALELGGDVKRLLAQAIGLTEPEEERPAPAADAPAADPAGPAAMSAQGPIPGSTDGPVPDPAPGTAPEPAPAPVRLVEAAPAEPLAAPEEAPAALAPDLPPVPLDPAPVPARRHGGARPV